MEVRVNAVVLRAVDYGENDKILTLLSAEEGKITAGIKGVRKAGAKLKFASQPFCFAEYVLTRSSGRSTVISAAERESFYDIRGDIIKFYSACAACETAETFSMEGFDSGDMLSALLRCLRDICNGDEKKALINFCLYVLDRVGYAVEAGDCPICGKSLSSGEMLRFDFSAGAFTCAECSDGPQASPATYALINALTTSEDSEPPDFSSPFDSADTAANAARLSEASDAVANDSAASTEETEIFTDDAEKRALKLLREYIRSRASSQCRCLTELIQIL